MLFGRDTAADQEVEEAAVTWFPRTRYYSIVMLSTIYDLVGSQPPTKSFFFFFFFFFFLSLVVNIKMILL